jgi:hypothetical protein
MAVGMVAGDHARAFEAGQATGGRGKRPGTVRRYGVFAARIISAWIAS